MIRAAILGLSVLATSAMAQGMTPGETSGGPLMPLLVTDYDHATGEVSLAYQTGCDTLDNHIYIGSLEDVSTLNWSREVCSIGAGGRYENFNPGGGSYFFAVVGNDGRVEGSYGLARRGGNRFERRPSLGACGLAQDLSNTCSPVTEGESCASGVECGSRQICVEDIPGAAECACLAPFANDFCQSCAPGYTGPDCRQCATGFFSNATQNATGDDTSEDLTSPQHFRCEPDVPGSCSGISCSGWGTCQVTGHDAICACDEGHTGSKCGECAPNYEHDGLGACVLRTGCREAKCGGHGECTATPFGDVICQCDSGFSGPDCGGPDLAIQTDSERFSLYEGETIVLEPVGGDGPYTYEVFTGSSNVFLSCSPDLGCPPGGAMLTIVAPAGGIRDLTLIQVALYDNAGHSATQNFVALPPTVLPFTGNIHGELLPFYRGMLEYMRARGIRAGVLGISKGGAIIATNGYGYRDARIDAEPFVNAAEPGPLVQPNSPFRIASVSKPLTAAAVRQAATDVGVDITSSATINRAATWVQESTGFSLVNGTPPFDYNLFIPQTTDFRWSDVTIQHLLNHHAGFRRDIAPSSTTGQPAYNGTTLPFTEDLDDPTLLQTAKTGTSSDISYATMYAVAALQLADDPRPTVENMIRFTAGTTLNYNPGGSIPAGADNYSNIGYILAGRVLEGLKGQTYDADEPGVPMGWGSFPDLLQDYLCEASGVYNGIHPGDPFNPQTWEPYYRSLNSAGVEDMEWNLAEGAQKIRFNEGIQQWQFCQSGCPAQPGAVWNDDENTPKPYGGIWLAERNSAGGIVATTSALLKFARNHRVKVGSPNEGTGGIGTLLPSPGSYGSSSSHSGSLPGTRSYLWQMGGPRNNAVPQESFAWHEDPSEPLDLDSNGLIQITETLLVKPCSALPSDVAVAVMFNQREDRRAPLDINVQSPLSGSSVSTVYRRIIDILGDAACQVTIDGWPPFSDPDAIAGVPQTCP